MSDNQLPENQKESNNEQQSKTSSGLDQNIAALLSYLLGFVTGIIFLLLEKENRFVRFHALQSIFTSVMLIVLNIVIDFIPFIGWILALLLQPLTLVLFIILLVKAYQGEYFKLPWIGDMVEKQLDN